MCIPANSFQSDHRSVGDRCDAVHNRPGGVQGAGDGLQDRLSDATDLVAAFELFVNVHKNSAILSEKKE